MADEADLADGYGETLVAIALMAMQTHRSVENDEPCEFCEENPREKLRNGVCSKLCERCRLEKEAEDALKVLPVTVVAEQPQQGDNEDDTWTPTMIDKRTYRKNWMIKGDPCVF
ncbi:hypothetical protein DLP05_081 [Stenotrophomonas phage vB_SmaS_DLP_5]|uniref:Uncharacterized protein n=1 Tax=Stenotrophomonas phage vB_SmaS_DLP_5 TaxID=2044561 RepID=A0A2D2W2L4_9CAUD|nr:hypothetical protein FDJ07_gp140 [Stenotrophomonas phage vB_SmaS_DLP_5]ATS92368.1 hypothetical protein DLP05_081 [Stenotrophomonas phage vB_SmaS_DLP_5]